MNKPVKVGALVSLRGGRDYGVVTSICSYSTNYAEITVMIVESNDHTMLSDYPVAFPLTQVDCVIDLKRLMRVATEHSVQFKSEVKRVRKESEDVRREKETTDTD